MSAHNRSKKASAGGSSIELFTGGGGLALAMDVEGFRHLVAVENNPRACETLRDNIADVYSVTTAKRIIERNRWPLIESDVREVDFTRWRGEVDLVAGGVPCQPWSIAGSRLGYEDPRNLWPELFRVVRQTRPLVVVAENVTGLLRPFFRPYYDYVLRELSAPFEERVEDEEWMDHDKRLVKALASEGDDQTERYVVNHHVLNAADYGVPQHRKRVFVVAFRADLGLGPWEAPKPSHSEAALVREQANGLYWERHGIEPRLGYAADMLDVTDDSKPWQTLRDAIVGLPTPVLDRQEHPEFLHHVGWPGAREYRGHLPSDLDRPAKTVKAGVHGVAGGECTVRLDDGSVRYLTVREVARLMTFPDDWRLAGSRGPQMRQLGNAVPVALGRAVARSVADALRSAREA
ncbi:DNA cytosine methyltransferase [Micromonospora purpureochromogenes]|uniref:DNA cytosine methyltransferase n=1 Tax=Micromonospora purpureochromogenes TaxID=47872 RepID=UPI00362C93CB